MHIRRRLVLFVLCALIACAKTDSGPRQVKRTFKVASVAAAPLRLELVPDDCPSEKVVVELGVNNVDSSRKANVSCLAALQVGASVKHEMQKLKQGCVPGGGVYHLVGGCETGPLALTSTGTTCAKK